MVRATDLARLSRLVALCDAQHRLAAQEQTRASDEAHMATHRREASERAAVEAERFWRRMVRSGVLEPQLAGSAGDELIACADVVTASIDHEAQARRTLAECERAQREAHARLRQTEHVAGLWRREIRHRRDERLLAEIADRTAYCRRQK